MIKNSIALHLQSKTNSEMADHAQQIHNSLMTSLIYTAPPVSLADQQAAIDKLNRFIKEWGVQGQRGGRLAHTHLISARDAVREIMKQLAHYCMSVTPNAPISWEAIGFVTKLKREKAGNPGAAEKVRMVVSPKVLTGFLKLRWNKPLDTTRRRSVYYRVMRSADSLFSHAESIAIVTKTTFTDCPQQKGVIYYYWIVAMNAYGDAPVSDVCAAAAQVV